MKKITESRYTRMADTDEQEAAIAALETTLKACGAQIWGATTIGRAPQTVILDLSHQGSEIYVDDYGEVKIKGEPVEPSDRAAVCAAAGITDDSSKHPTPGAAARAADGELGYDEELDVDPSVKAEAARVVDRLING